MDVDLSFGQKNSYNMVVCVSIPVMHKSEFIDFSHLMVLTTNCHFLYVLDNYCNLKTYMEKICKYCCFTCGSFSRRFDSRSLQINSARK